MKTHDDHFRLIKKPRPAGQLFFIICGFALSLGSHDKKGYWGEPHESVFAQHLHEETI